RFNRSRPGRFSDGRAPAPTVNAHQAVPLGVAHNLTKLLRWHDQDSHRPWFDIVSIEDLCFVEGIVLDQFAGFGFALGLVDDQRAAAVFESTRGEELASLFQTGQVLTMRRSKLVGFVLILVVDERGVFQSWPPSYPVF